MAINPTAIWRVRSSGSNTNGGGYDPGIAGAGTDYSQQNAAQVSGTHGTAAGTATFTDLTAANFTSAMVGNALYLTGTGFTTGWYFVVGFTSSSVVTLDRSPGTGTATGTWNLGGGWADPWTNVASSGPIVSGNALFVLGSGVPNPSSYIYDYTYSGSGVTIANGSIVFAVDPATPSYKAPPDATGGMPVIKFTGANIWATIAPQFFKGFWFVGGSGISAGSYVVNDSGGAVCEGCVLDQFGFDIGLMQAVAAEPTALGCEVFSSQGGTGGINAAMYAGGSASQALNSIGNNFHDCVGYGLYCNCSGAFNAVYLTATATIIAKCGNSGIYLDSFDSNVILNNTIDGNAGDGITFGTNIGFINSTVIVNNILSNHTGVGKYGVNTAGGTKASFNGAFAMDYNTYYNNTADISVMPYGPHDTHGGANPYVNQATENYTLS